MVWFDRNKTLNELERFPNKPHFDSSLVRKCLDLRDKKLKDFNAGDLRIMIGQKESLEYLIPMALEVLSENPFIQGDLYFGDLLEQIMNVAKEFWVQNKNLNYELDEIIVEVKSFIEGIFPVINAYKPPYG